MTGAAGGAALLPHGPIKRLRPTRFPATNARRCENFVDQGERIAAMDTKSPERIAIGPPPEPGPAYGPWNPGIESTLPTEFLPLATVFSAANVSSSITELKEIHSFCGLALERLSTFKPARLALHEVLIRVMADLSVPDGEKYEDLGVNFRKMTATILDNYIAPKISEINRVFDQLKREASDFIDKAQTAVPSLNDGVKATRDSSARRWSRLFLPSGKRTQVKTSRRAPADQDIVDIAHWRTKA